jgi:hydroxypyruvate reductase
MDREEIMAIINAALKAVDPAEAIRKVVKREGNNLIVAGKTYNLEKYRRVIVIGGGKAGAPMAAAVEGILGERITKVGST